ncbi:MAG: anthranilate phosphoribosyltransferase [Lachnospiraceae bacterium]|nr:anthranilate phosphoribosyltransferase [Lachnospiraceae bacterium]
MILLIDNYDSFSYNLVQYLGSLAEEKNRQNPGAEKEEIRVIRNDEMTVEQIEALKPSYIVLSPGPGRPQDAGVCEEVIRKLQGKSKILGVCLGHQAICEVYGATVTYAKRLMHGKQSICKVDVKEAVFRGIAEETTVARYHSLAADPDTIPDCLKVIARTDDGEIMAVRHKDYEVYGLQFHPESVLTPEGMKILANFLECYKENENNDQNNGRTKAMIKEAIGMLVEGKDIGYEMARKCTDEIMSGDASQMLMASYLTALRMKGETVDEIVGSAEGMRAAGTHLSPKTDVLEIVGTGGDEAFTFNISTTSSIVIAASGQAVAKHGNRSVSSKCGAADVLDALGVNIMLDPEKMEKVLETENIAFMHAQVYHKAMRFVGPVRKELGTRTVFNILGPLTNPAGATLQVMGVYSKELVEPMAHVLSKLGVKRGLVVYGMDRLDEISMSDATYVCEINNGEFKTYEITPEQFGLTRATKEDMVGGDAVENAKITRDILSGVKGPKRDSVLLNAGAGLYVAGKADSIADGVKLAAELIDSGKAMEKLEAFIKATNEAE